MNRFRHFFAICGKGFHAIIKGWIIFGKFLQGIIIKIRLGNRFPRIINRQSGRGKLLRLVEFSNCSGRLLLCQGVQIDFPCLAGDGKSPLFPCLKHSFLNFASDGNHIGAISQFAAFNNGKSTFVSPECIGKAVGGIKLVSDSHLLENALFKNIIPNLDLLHDIVIRNLKFKGIHLKRIRTGHGIFGRSLLVLRKCLRRDQRKS